MMSVHVVLCGSICFPIGKCRVLTDSASVSEQTWMSDLTNQGSPEAADKDVTVDTWDVPDDPSAAASSCGNGPVGRDSGATASAVPLPGLPGHSSD